MEAEKHKIDTKVSNHYTNCEGNGQQGGIREFGVPKNMISTWIKNKDKLFEGLEQSSSDTKKIRGC